MTKYCIVLTTISSSEEAKPIIQRLVAQKIAACVQEVKINSHYIWKNEYCNDNEVLLLIKSRDELFDEIKSTILSTHSYETPEIIKIAINGGHEPYLNWIDIVTKPID